MAKVSTSKDCFFGGKLYRKGDKLEYTGAEKDMPSYFLEVGEKAVEKSKVKSTKA